MALAEREEAREVRQQAERARREWEIEERVKREASAQEANNTLGVDASDTGAGGFRGIETSSAATVKDDLAAESDGSGGNLDYSDIWKAQTGHETPRAIQGPVIEGVLVGEVSRSLECVMATSESPAPSPSMPMGQPAAIKLPSPPNSDDQGYKLSDELGVKPFVEMPSNLAHFQEEISQTISDIDSSDDGEKEGKREKEATLAFDELLIADDSADEHMALDGGEPVKLMIGCEDVQATGLSELLPPETFANL
ncbi:hypothetical protein HOY82DRAFT_210274 [Tuber indicum]|nr:hypothetical protein HOY82DRAFT_210274 [Tuber indicum]